MNDASLDNGRGRVPIWLSQFARNKMFLIMLGGALGSYLRYCVGRWCGDQPWGQSFPFGTLIVNVAGSFLLGLAAVVILERLAPEHQGWFLLIGTGFCGGLTTFSTFELETFKLVRDGSWWYALANVGGSFAAGFVALLLGVALGSLLFARN
jgi:CrcB protein